MEGYLAIRDKGCIIYYRDEQERKKFHSKYRKNSVRLEDGASEKNMAELESWLLKAKPYSYKIKFNNIIQYYTDIMTAQEAAVCEEEIINIYEQSEEPTEEYIHVMGISDVENYLKETMSMINDFCDKLPEIRKQLRHDLRIKEREFLDVRHDMEINDDKNIVEGYKSYKMARDVLRERRTIKNNMARIDAVLFGGLKDVNNKYINDRFDGIDNQHYNPRELNELFANERMI